MMKLLTEEELVWSAVVANNRMNRKRKASGVNSYERELGFSPESFLETCIARYGSVRWLDLCCGEGNALIEAAQYLDAKGLQEKAVLTGIDLVPHFSALPAAIQCVQFFTGSVHSNINGTYDLVTCIHGLHYLGDKLGVLEAACGALSAQGLFAGNFSIDNIRGEQSGIREQVKSAMKLAGVQYNSRKHMVVCEGRRQLHFGLHYLGADDTAGANYTGQEVVDSWYRL